jgi:hypothetical protein
LLYTAHHHTQVSAEKINHIHISTQENHPHF